MPHGGFACTLAGDVFGQPGRIRGKQKYHVTCSGSRYYVTGEDGWNVAAAKTEKAADKEARRLNRGGKKKPHPECWWL